MPDQLLIADSGPLIALASMNRLDLLAKLFPRVAVPPAVLDEVVSCGADRPGFNLVSVAPWIIRLPPPPTSVVLPAFLDVGESEVLSAALAAPGASVLIDDYRARRAAEAFRIPVIGLIGVLSRAKHHGYISKVAPLLHEAVRNGYYISNELITRVQSNLAE